MEKKDIYPEYEKGVNYLQLVIDYEKKYCSHEYKQYSPEMVWGSHDDKKNDDIFFYKLFCHNLYKGNQIRNLQAEMEKFKKLNEVVDGSTFLWAFITVGWNEQTITPEKMLLVSKRISQLKYFNYCDFVLEKHRENGIHHHTHFLVKFADKFPPSKIIGWIYKTKGVSDICSDQNFVDYLGPQKPKKKFQPFSTYFEYVRGQKRVDKLSYVGLDRDWRDSHHINHLYTHLENISGDV